MRIGIMSSGTRGVDATLDGLLARAKDLEARGFDTMWMANVFGHDAIGALGIVGHITERIELGTAVVPTYPRHPAAIAQQCLTTQAASGGRFVLGIGLSHPVVIEQLLGLSYERRAQHMAEYMAVLGPLLRGEPVAFDGDEYHVHMTMTVSDASPVPVVIAALGDRMLRIAGRDADGTILWMTGPKTIETHIAPKLNAAAREAGKPAPRIVAGIPILLTNYPERAREKISKTMRMYGSLPSYKAMLEKEGVAGPAEIAMLGDEQVLGAALDRLRDVGVTDFEASILPIEDGADERTLSFLQSRL